MIQLKFSDTELLHCGVVWQALSNCYPEHQDSMFFRYNGNHLLDYTVSQPRRSQMFLLTEVCYSKHDHYIGHCLSSQVLSNMPFQKLDRFPSSGVREKSSYSVKASLDDWAHLVYHNMNPHCHKNLKSHIGST